jgi:SAM-dependent methyltransferase
MPLLGNGVVLSNRVSRPPRDGVASGARGCHRPARDRGTGRGRRLRSRRVGHRHGGILPGFDDIGIDFHGPSVATARERADEAAVAGRASFEVASAAGYDGAYDLICFFDCLHDMGDPVSVARHAREHLVPGGTVLLVEPFAIYGRAGNVAQNPMAPLVCTVSSAICVPNTLSQEVGLGLDAQAGEEQLRAVFEEAGFTHFRRATETPQNLILEARA